MNTYECECLICHKIIGHNGMASHIKRTHKLKSTQEYYDKYFIGPTTNKCLQCGNDTNFVNIAFGYRKFCCQDCARRHAIEITKKKYKVSNISQVPEINAKMRKSIKDNWDNIPKDLRNYRNKSVDNKIKLYCEENDLSPINILVQKYGTGFMQNDLNLIKFIKYKNRLLVKNSDIPIIEQYANMHVRSKHETYLYNLVKIYYPDAIQNTRKVIKNRELDIYIPSLKLAIEYNGIRFHNIEHSNKMKTLHLDKSLECREQDIRLIHIYQFENFDEQIKLLIDLFEGDDNYPENDFNKNNLIKEIPKPKVIYKTDKYTIYGAGKLY